MSISITGWVLSQAQPTWSFCGDPECFIILCAICWVFELPLKTVYEACVCALWKRLFLIFYTVAYFRAVGVCGQPLSTINSWFILFNFGFIHFIWVTFSVLLDQWMNEVLFIAADHLCVSAVGLTTERVHVIGFVLCFGYTNNLRFLLFRSWGSKAEDLWTFLHSSAGKPQIWVDV